MWAKIVAFFMSILALLGINIKGNTTHPPRIEEVSSFSVISECRYLQGACTDGKYIYQAFSHQVESTKEGNYIFKIDAKTYEVIDKVALTAGHMNDMTYNSRINKIVSADSASATSKSYMVTIIDPETLEVEEKINIGKGIYIYSIDYDAVNDIYYAGRYDKSIIVFDSKFNIINEISVDFEDYTKQSIVYNDGKLFVLLYGTKVSKPNIIRCYSTNGNFLYDYEIGIDEGEPESLFKLNGKFHVTYSAENYTMGVIYRLNELGK